MVAHLYIAAQKGHIEVARALVEAGADVDKAAPEHEQMLTYAEGQAHGQGHIEVARALVEAGADVNKARITYNTSVCCAQERSHRSGAFPTALRAGADVNKAEEATAHRRPQGAHIEVVRLPSRGAGCPKEEDE